MKVLFLLIAIIVLVEQLLFFNLITVSKTKFAKIGLLLLISGIFAACIYFGNPELLVMIFSVLFIKIITRFFAIEEPGFFRALICYIGVRAYYLFFISGYPLWYFCYSTYANGHPLSLCEANSSAKIMVLLFLLGFSVFCSGFLCSTVLNSSLKKGTVIAIISCIFTVLCSLPAVKIFAGETLIGRIPAYLRDLPDDDGANSFNEDIPLDNYFFIAPPNKQYSVPFNIKLFAKMP